MTVETKSKVIPPYGGTLINLVVTGEERKALLEEASRLPYIQISQRALHDLELLAVGGFSPLSATLMRMIVAAVVIWGFALLRGRAGQSLRALTDRRASLSILGGAIAGPFLGVWLSLIAVNLTQVGIAATLMALSPIFLLLPSHWIFNERISLQSVVGTVLPLGGWQFFFCSKDWELNNFLKCNRNTRLIQLTNG